MMNQKGYAIPAFLALLPLLLSIAAFAMGSFLILKENRRAHFECRTGLLEVQDKLLSNMNQLLDLNLKARLLYAKRLAAEAAVLAAAANPPLLAAAQQALRAIITQQYSLETLQKSIIAKANLGSRVQTRNVSKKVSKFIKSSHSPTLAVRPTSRRLAPEYEVAPEIERQHTIKISWIFKPLQTLPSWLNKILKQQPIEFTAECSTTSEKEKSKWQARLKRDKSSLSLL